MPATVATGTPAERMDRAAARLIRQHPFFGRLLLRQRIVADPGAGTMDTDGRTLRYAPAYVRAAQGWNAKGVILSGRDADAHWGNPPRPAQD